MLHQNMFKQMISFQKATFDNSFIAMERIQENGEIMFSTFLDQAAWMPEEGKRAIQEWKNSCRTERETFKKNISENFKTIEQFTQTFAGKKVAD